MESQDTRMVEVMVLLYLQTHIHQNHILQDHSDSQDLYERPAICMAHNAFPLYG